MRNVGIFVSFTRAPAGSTPTVQLMLLLLLLGDDRFFYYGPIFNDIGLAQHVDKERSGNGNCLLPLFSRSAVGSRLTNILFRFLE